MKTVRGPAICLAQFAAETTPCDSLGAIAGWAASLGYKGVQIPTWEKRLFDLDRAADSDAYCDDGKSIRAHQGIEISELAMHLQGQPVAVQPAYDRLSTHLRRLRCGASGRLARPRAVDQLKKAARASARPGLTAQATFSDICAARLRGARSR